MDNEKYVAFIGPKNMGEALRQIDPTWNMQMPFETLDAFQNELSSPTCRVNENTSLVIFFSWLFPNNPWQFAELVAYMAPYAVTCILMPEADMATQKEQILDAIRSAQRTKAGEDSSYNQNTPVFFVRYENPQEDIFDSIQRFIQNSTIDVETVEIVKKLLPEIDIEEENNITYGFEDQLGEEEIKPEEKDEDNHSTVIAVTSSKGGTGKSSIAILLGAYIAKASQLSREKGLEPSALKVCMVDLDVRDGQLGFLTGNLRPSIIDIVVAGQPTIQNVQKGIFTNKKTGVDFVFAAKRPRSAKVIQPAYYADLISTLRKMYDVIILDTSVNYLDPLLESVAYPMADHIIFVSDFYAPSVLGMARWISEVCENPDNRSKNIPKNKISICMNKFLQKVNMDSNKLESAAKDIPIIGVFPSTPGLLTYAGNTHSLEQVLNHPTFYNTTKNVVAEIIPHYQFAPLQ